jgi:predicted nucleic-acid-binding Zn-ribbon protein
MVTEIEFMDKDVVEVVRCKDCKYGDFYCNSILCGNSHAPWYNDEFDALMELDDYCSYGERKCDK